MSKFSGQQDFSGPKGNRKNKGVMRAYRRCQRALAEERNQHTVPKST